MTESWQLTDEEEAALTPEQRAMLGSDPDNLAARTSAAIKFRRQYEDIVAARKLTRDAIKVDREIEELTGKSTREDVLVNKIDDLEAALAARDRTIDKLRGDLERAKAGDAMAVFAGDDR